MSTPADPRSDTQRTIVAREPAETPWLSVVLGYGPMLPFLVGAGLTWWLRGSPGDTVATLTALWGCAILLFLAGVRRGISFRTEGGPTAVQIGTMAGLFGLGLAALLAITFGFAATALALLVVGYLAVALLDPIAARRGEAPLFFRRLRPLQMPLALVGLTALLAYRFLVHGLGA